MKRKYYLALPFITALIENKDGKILLGKHPYKSDKPFPGHWDLPGGKLKENETFEECLIREVKEETGFEVREMEIHKVHHNYGKSVPKNAIPGVSVCYKVSVSGDFKPSEMDNMRFVDIEEISEFRLTPWTEYFLEEFI